MQIRGHDLPQTIQVATTLVAPIGNLGNGLDLFMCLLIKSQFLLHCRTEDRSTPTASEGRRWRARSLRFLLPQTGQTKIQVWQKSKPTLRLPKGATSVVATFIV